MNSDLTKTPPFTITARALKEIHFITTEKNIPENYKLRVGVKGGGGCGGASFLLGFDQKKEGDDIYIIEGISILMEKKHAIFLAGKEIDFEDGAMAKGFVFI